MPQRSNWFSTWNSWVKLRCAGTYVVAVSVVTCVWAGYSTAQDSPPPNIVLVFVDDMGWADWERDATINPTGGLLYQTPNLLALAQQSVQLRNAYAAAPVCTPTRAALMTGMRPARNGMTQLTHKVTNHQTPTMRDTLVAGDNNSIRWEENLPLGNTLGEVLKTRGYQNAFFGKWHLANTNAETAANPLNAGFDVNVGGDISGSPNGVGGFFAGADGAWNLPGLRASDGADYASDKYLSDVLTEKAEEFIETSAASNDPFFVMMSHYDVHTPNQAPGINDEGFADYQAFVSRRNLLESQGVNLDGHRNPNYAWKLKKMDDSLGQLMSRLDDPNGDGLKDDSVRDNTVVIFASDNGGESSSTSNSPLRSVKGSAYEGGVRAPFLFSWTGNTHVQQGRIDNHALTSTEDIYSTLIDVAGIAPPAVADQLDGVSLRGLMEGGSAEKSSVIWHYPHLANGNFAGREFYSGIRSGEWKLLYFYDDETYELYNVADDLAESNNLIEERTDIAHGLSLELRNYLVTVNAKYPIRQGYSEGEVDAPPVVGLVSYYDFEGSLPDFLDDRSADGNLNNGVALDGAQQDAMARVGSGALQLDGQNDAVSLGQGDVTRFGDSFTFAAWVKQDNSGGDQTILGSGASGNGHLRFAIDDGVVRLGAFSANNGWAITPSTGAPVLTTDQWHHLVGVYDGASLSIYVDGVFYSRRSQSGIIQPNTQLIDLAIGAQSSAGGGFFDGSIDELSLWNIPLSEGKAKAIFNMAQESGLVDLAILDLVKLYQAYDSQGSVNIDGTTWYYVSGLNNNPGDVSTAILNSHIVQLGNGDGMTTLLLGDFDDDGVVGLLDWPVVRDNLLNNVSGLGQEGRYLRGDLTLDGFVNEADFLLFRTALEQMNGAGSFAASIYRVPEPPTLALYAAYLAVLKSHILSWLR